MLVSAILKARVPLWLAAPVCLVSTLAGGWMMNVGQPASCRVGPALLSDSADLSGVSMFASANPPGMAETVVNPLLQSARHHVNTLAPEAAYEEPLEENADSRMAGDVSVANNDIHEVPPDAQAAANVAYTVAERDATARALLGNSVELPKDADETVVVQALSGLVADGQRTAEDRIEAAYLLAQGYRDNLSEVATPLLAMAQNSDDTQLQEDVLYALDGRMTPTLVGPVSAFSGHGDVAVRTAALQLLQQAKHETAARAALQRIAQGDASDYLRYLAQRALDSPE